MTVIPNTGIEWSCCAREHESSLQGSRLRHRRIDPKAGRALEILRNAIEYLADEFVHEKGEVTAQNPQLEAIQLLMAVNRQIYLECPEVPSFTERWRSFFEKRQ